MVVVLLGLGALAATRQLGSLSYGGMAFGAVLGGLSGLVHVRFWTKTIPYSIRMARRHPDLWLLFPEDATPQGRQSIIVGICLWIIMFCILGPGSLAAGLQPMVGLSGCIGALTGWTITWNYGYLVWWRQLPRE